MDSQKYGRTVISNKTENQELMIENRYLKAELASVKYELAQAILGNDEMRQLYWRANLKCIELEDENRRLNKLLSNVGKLIKRGTIQSSPSAGMTCIKRGEQEGSTPKSSNVGDRHWQYLKTNGEVSGRDWAHANPNASRNEERNEQYTNRKRSSRELTVSSAIAVADNTQPTFDETWKSLPKAEEKWLLQPSCDIEKDSDGEYHWLYETLDDITSAELLNEEDTTKNVLAEVNSPEWEEVHCQDPAKASVNVGSTDAFESKAFIELLAPPPESSFECYLCRKTFKRRIFLTRHIRSHTGHKLFHCEYESCGKSFIEKNNFAKHKRIHSGERPFQCEFSGCVKKFKQNIHLTQHRRLHTGENPHVCQQAGCTAGFRWSYQLKAHIRGSHSI